MIVIINQLLLDVHDLRVHELVGVGPGPVEVLPDQVTPAVLSVNYCF